MRPPHRQTCKAAGGHGIRDPEGRCDPELEVVRPLGEVWSRSFDRIDLLSRGTSGFWVASSMKLEPAGIQKLPNGTWKPAPEGGVAIVELSSDGAPLRQCFSTTHGFTGGTAGIRDTARDSGGRLALTGWIWGKDLSFGGKSISARAGSRSSYLAVLTAQAKHVFSHGLGGPGSDATSVAFDARGNAVVAGTYSQTLDLGAAKIPAFEHTALFVAKFDEQGRLLWVHVSPGGASHLTPSVTFSPAGTVIVVGTYHRYLNFGTPLPNAAAVESPACASQERRASHAHRMFWVELDSSGRELRSQSFGEPHAQAFDIAFSPEGDFIVTGAFRGSMSFGGPPLRAPRSPGTCGCDLDCMYPLSRFVVRLDGRRRVLFQDTLPDSRILRALPGPSGSTIVEQGIVVSFRQQRRTRVPEDYRWSVQIRSRAGVTRWTRAFEKFDLKAAAPFGSGRLALLIHDPERAMLSLLIYRPAIWSSPAPPLPAPATRPSFE